MSVNVAAVDLGASSGRVMLGRVGADELRLEAVTRFGNDPVRLPDGLHWNIVELYRQSLLGLRLAVGRAGTEGLISVAVDSWAVDYGLLRRGSLLGLPYHYRDERRSAVGVEPVHGLVSAEELYRRNGLQFLPFNTLYQLMAETFLEVADQALLIPDLVGWCLTQVAVTERTNASTTGLLDVHTQDWDTDLFARLGIEPALFPDLVDPGSTLGAVTGEVAPFLGESASGLRVVTVGSHDTASAVVGVPLTDPHSAYISCGTWGLVGVELDKPVVTEASRAANFTNEGGVDGRTRFLTNVMGTWLLSETLRTWDREGQPSDLPTLLREAADQTGEGTLFDVQDPRFLPPGDMPTRIQAWCVEHDRPVPRGPVAIVLSIVRSLAEGFATALEQAADLSGVEARRVHVVGGGAQNELLCQLLADRTGLPVIAGPVEATALGNVLVQGRAAGAVTGSLEDLRSLVTKTQHLREYRPQAHR